MVNGQKKLDFVEDLVKGQLMYTRKFTRIYVDGEQLSIGHTIHDRKTNIDFEHIREWINYFDKI